MSAGPVLWDPAAYQTFNDHRGRPFHDLLAQVATTGPRRVVDVGCGPGTVTRVLAQRWPRAHIEAFDSSPEMVAAARANGIDASVADAGQWSPGPEVDVLVANAVLQWVPEHAAVLARWAGALTRGAWLAMQVPGNFTAPSHVLTRELAGEAGWAGELGGVLRGANTVLDPREYAELLIAEGCTVDAWETTYAHRLTGPDPVLAWITGTALRPVRAALDDAGWESFRAQLAPRLRAAYPPTADGSTWLPFRRVFVVAHR